MDRAKVSFVGHIHMAGRQQALARLATGVCSGNPIASLALWTRYRRFFMQIKITIRLDLPVLIVLLKLALILL